MPSHFLISYFVIFTGVITKRQFFRLAAAISTRIVIRTDSDVVSNTVRDRSTSAYDNREKSGSIDTGTANPLQNVVENNLDNNTNTNNTESTKIPTTLRALFTQINTQYTNQQILNNIPKIQYFAGEIEKHILRAYKHSVLEMYVTQIQYICFYFARYNIHIYKPSYVYERFVWGLVTADSAQNNNKNYHNTTTDNESTQNSEFNTQLNTEGNSSSNESTNNGTIHSLILTTLPHYVD